MDEREKEKKPISAKLKSAASNLTKAKTPEVDEIDEDKDFDEAVAEANSPEGKKKKKNLTSTFLKFAPAILGVIGGNSNAVKSSLNLLAADDKLAIAKQEARAQALEAKKKAINENREFDLKVRKQDFDELDRTADNVRADKNTVVQEQRAGFEKTRIENAEKQQVIDNNFERKKLENSNKALEVQVKNANLRAKELDLSKKDLSEKQKSKEQAKIDKEKKELSKLEIKGVGFATSAKEAEQGRDVLSKTNQALGTLKKIVELRKAHGAGTIFNRADIAEGKSLAKDLQIVLKSKSFFDLGVLQKADLELLEGIVGSNPLGIDFTGATEAKFKQAEDLILNKAGSFFNSRGFDSPFSADSQVEDNVNSEQPQPAPHGDTVTRNGKNYRWNATRGKYQLDQ